jgi:hypothetical protein
MPAGFNKLFQSCVVFLKMNRCILTLITAFIVTSSFAQSDFIQLKKNDKVIQNWFKGNYITCELDNDQWVQAVIYKIQYDSLYLRPYALEVGYNRLGLNTMDTVFYGLMTINVNRIKSFPKTDESFSYVKNGLLFKIAGGGYLLLNAINTLSDHEDYFSSDNVPKIAIGASILAVGIVLGLTHKTTYIVGKKYHIEYISAKASS